MDKADFIAKIALNVLVPYRGSYLSNIESLNDSISRLEFSSPTGGLSL